MKLLCLKGVILYFLLGFTDAVYPKINGDSACSKSLTARDSSLFLSEQVFLHIANGHLRKGNLFFKSYIFSNFNFKGATLSRILFVELLDSELNVIRTQSHKIVGGEAHGNIAMDKDMEPGKYTLRAYTSLMKNQHEAYSRQDIWIGESTSTTKQVENSIVDVVPEGGVFLHGFENRIVIKLIDGNSFGSGRIGTVVDSKGSKVSDIHKYGNCLATAIFTPRKSGIYRILLEDDSEYEISHLVEQGYQIQVNSIDKEKIKIKVRTTEEVENEDVKLVATLGGVDYLKTELYLESKGEMDIQLDKKDFPDGMFNFEIRNVDGNILASRPFAIKREALQIQATVVSGLKSNRKIRLKVTDMTGKPVKTKLSVSVNPGENLVNENGHCENLDFLDLQLGNVPNHNDNIRQSRMQLFLTDLNVQLLYSKFGPSERFVTSESKEMEFRGIAYDMNNNLLTNTDIQVMAMSETESLILEKKTDRQGMLTVENLDLTGEAQLVFRTKGDNTKERLVKMKRIITPPVPMETKKTELSNNGVNRAMRPSTTKDLGYIDDKDLIELDEVEVADKRIDYYHSPSNYNLPETSSKSNLKFQNLENPLPIEQMLSTFNGVYVSNLGTSNPSLGSLKGVSPLYLLDGLVVAGPGIPSLDGQTPLAEVMSLVSPADIYKVEFLFGPDAALFGSRGAGGAFLIYTRNGSRNEYINREEAKVDFRGFEPTLDFATYTNEISKRDMKEIKLLYWNPNLETDEKGEVSITFDSFEDISDVNLKAYTITTNGISGRLVKTLELPRP